MCVNKEIAFVCFAELANDMLGVCMGWTFNGLLICV